MGKKKRKGSGLKSTTKNRTLLTNFKRKIYNFFKNPLNTLIFKFSALLVFYAFWISPFFQTQVVENVAIFYAQIAGFIIKIFNYPILISGDTLGHSNFSISIKNGCDAIEATAILLCGMLVYPAKFKYKVVGLLFGGLILVAINLFRIVSLYFNGIYTPSIFEFMHTGVWQVLFIIFPIIIIFRWINWINRRKLIGL